MNEDLGNKFQLAARFVELLAERATRTGHVASSWEKLPPAWKSIFAAAVLAFLEEWGCGLIANEAMIEKQEDEQIRLFCEGLTARRRLKMYRQLYALTCRIDGIDQAIEKLGSRTPSPWGAEFFMPGANNMQKLPEATVNGAMRVPGSDKR